MATPRMAEQLDLPQFIALAHKRSDHAIAMKGLRGQAFRVTSAEVPVNSSPALTDTIQIAVDVSQEEVLLARYQRWFGAIMLGAFVIFPVAGYQDCAPRHSSRGRHGDYGTAY